MECSFHHISDQHNANILLYVISV